MLVVPPSRRPPLSPSPLRATPLLHSSSPPLPSSSPSSPSPYPLPGVPTPRTKSVYLAQTSSLGFLSPTCRQTPPRYRFTMPSTTHEGQQGAEGHQVEYKMYNHEDEVKLIPLELLLALTKRQTKKKLAKSRNSKKRTSPHDGYMVQKLKNFRSTPRTSGSRHHDRRGSGPKTHAQEAFTSTPGHGNDEFNDGYATQ